MHTRCLEKFDYTIMTDFLDQFAMDFPMLKISMIIVHRKFFLLLYVFLFRYTYFENY